MIRRFALALILTAGLSYATTCSDTDTQGTGFLDSSAGALTVGGSTTIAGQYLTGCLAVGTSANNGTLNVVTPSGFMASSPLSVTWTVTEPTAGNYVYNYAYTLPVGTEVSHVVLGLGSSCNSAEISNGSDCINTVTPTSSTVNQSHVGSVTIGSVGTTIPGNLGGNPNIPMTSGSEAINFQPTDSSLGGPNSWTACTLTNPPTGCSDTFTIQFDSTQAPVLQDIYIRDGLFSNEAWNTGASIATTGSGATLTSVSSGLFVAAPGTAVITGNTSLAPEPGFYGLLALGLAGIFFIRQRATRKRSDA